MIIIIIIIIYIHIYHCYGYSGGHIHTMYLWVMFADNMGLYGQTMDVMYMTAVIIHLSQVIHCTYRQSPSKMGHN